MSVGFLRRTKRPLDISIALDVTSKDRCWFRLNHIGDSMIEDDCAFDVGVVAANLCFDQDNSRMRMCEETIDNQRTILRALVGRWSRVDVNASLMAGVRAGAH